MKGMSEKARERLAHSLTAEDVALLPYLPYLLQDLWALGGTPEQAIALMRAHLPQTGTMLDLACGKGYMAVHIAKATGWRVHGTDIMPAFIEVAKQKAAEHGVGHLCSFAVQDANEAVQTGGAYNCVLFSANGDILGPPDEMLPKLVRAVRPGGYIILDESHLPNEGAVEIRYSHGYLRLCQWQALFARLGIAEVQRCAVSPEALRQTDASDQAFIQKRAAELAQKHPQKAALFAGYVQSQLNEVADVENSLENVVWLLRTPNAEGGEAVAKGI